ncbi:hypothetical protein [Paraburkholderia mimosarum]|uniref:hypothetical protein n=1 Tax=Paraburkholderia mimosarum TaxID=312026 RepID=UPI001EE1959D|nr:hypothetical protein [Paraburkholderia mimosarum]
MVNPLGPVRDHDDRDAVRRVDCLIRRGKCRKFVALSSVGVDATTQWIDAASRALRGIAMTTTESLLTLAEYLELSLNSGGSVIMMQKCNDVCAMYVGDASRDQDRLRYHGDIAATQAEEILEQTHAGRNRLEIGAQLYRFIRTFKHFEDRGAVVFAPS